MNPIIKEYLYTPNLIEKKQKKEGIFQLDIPSGSYNMQQNQMILLQDFFLNNTDIYISKHNRFAPYPSHTHEFLEINYVLSGSSKQNINGFEETIKEGELLLLDKNSAHSLETLNENDILINIIFTNKNMDLNWLTSIREQNSLLFNFLMHSLKRNTKGNYLLFHSSKNKHVQEIMQRILNEYFLSHNFAKEMIHMYLPILITELVANVTYSSKQEKISNADDSLVIKTLQLIEEKFQTITLTEAANSLGYNKNYLSNLIKKKTNLTFTELLNQQRMQHAHFLLENTDMTISEIISAIGLNNHTYFYRLFKTHYGVLPSTFRH